ncbi:hypothetical protein OAL43_03095 [bacterium]|nr:hypothetical protein [bacterium]
MLRELGRCCWLGQPGLTPIPKRFSVTPTRFHQSEEVTTEMITADFHQDKEIDDVIPIRSRLTKKSTGKDESTGKDQGNVKSVTEWIELG